jgi:nucleoside 2-deoxyribosyltransferase
MLSKKDLEAIQNSEAVYAIVDGLDSGTIYEIGYACELGLPVVALNQSESIDQLTMLVGSQCEIVSDFCSSIYRLAWKALER